MIPRNLPPGTTLRSVMEDLLPADHAAHVPADAGDASVGVRFVDGPCYSLVATGRRLTVTETPRVVEAPLLLSVDLETAQVFLDDWLGPQRLAPSFEPRGLQSVTDARFLRRVSAVKGVMSLTLDDLDGGPATLVVAAGPDASLYDDPDASVHVGMAAFQRVLAGTLTPDAAIVDGHVALSGKKLVAMQFALAMVPYFPERG